LAEQNTGTRPADKVFAGFGQFRHASTGLDGLTAPVFASAMVCILRLLAAWHHISPHLLVYQALERLRKRGERLGVALHGHHPFEDCQALVDLAIGEHYDLQ
jgi:hypothetical protein